MAKNKEKIKELLDKKYCTLLLEYKQDNSRRFVVQHQKGYKYDVSLNAMLKHAFSRIVETSNPFSLENISLYLKLNNKSFILISKNAYINNSIKNLEFSCFMCGERFSASWHDAKNMVSCPICSGQQVGKKKSLAFLKADLVKEWSNKNIFSPYDVTIYSTKRALWKCRKCGYEWVATIENRSLGTHCPACAGKVVTDKNKFSILFPELAKDWHLTKNVDLSLDDVSQGSSRKVWWECRVCGHNWKTSVSTRTKSGGTGCPNCSTSKGNNIVKNFLIKNNISFIPEYKFENCKNIRKLPFDFYLPEHNVLIEYDGILHYEDKFNNSLEFEKTKARDIVKTKYCIDNNIPLIRIPYWEFNNIESILNNYL